MSLESVLLGVASAGLVVAAVELAEPGLAVLAAAILLVSFWIFRRTRS